MSQGRKAAKRRKTQAPSTTPRGPKVPEPEEERRASAAELSKLRAKFLAAFEMMGGVEALVAWAMQSPKNQGAFYKILTGMVPKNVELTGKDGSPLQALMQTVVHPVDLSAFKAPMRKAVEADPPEQLPSCEAEVLDDDEDDGDGDEDEEDNPVSSVLPYRVDRQRQLMEEAARRPEVDDEAFYHVRKVARFPGKIPDIFDPPKEDGLAVICRLQEAAGLYDVPTYEERRDLVDAKLMGRTPSENMERPREAYEKATWGPVLEAAEKEDG